MNLTFRLQQRNMFGTQIFVFLLVLSASGCTTLHHVENRSVKSDGQELWHENGSKTLVSFKKHLVTLAPGKAVQESSLNTSFLLSVQNLWDGPITVGSENVSVSFEPNSQKSKSKTIKVFSYSDLMVEIDKQESKQRSLASISAVAGSMSAIGAGYSTSTNTYSGNTYGSFRGNSYGNYGYTPYSINTTGSYSGGYGGTSRTTTYNPFKTQILANQNQANYERSLAFARETANENRKRVENLVMKTQTLNHKEVNKGLVVIDTRKMSYETEGRFKIIVAVDGERHIFLVDRTMHRSENQ